MNDLVSSYYAYVNMSAAYVTWFWIAWQGSVIFVGTGNIIGQNVLMYSNNSIDMPPSPINGLLYRSMKALPCYFTFINETVSEGERKLTETFEFI